MSYIGRSVDQVQSQRVGDNGSLSSVISRGHMIQDLNEYFFTPDVRHAGKWHINDHHRDHMSLFRS